MKITGQKIYLKNLNENDASEEYVNWMNDKKITRFLESGNKKITVSNIKNYIFNCNNSKTEVLFGIFIRVNNKHIGNIKLSNINLIHKKAYVGIMIGDSQEWGNNYGQDAINLLVNYAFSKLNLNKIKAGIIFSNKASIRLFEKCKFRLESKNINEVFFEKKFVNTLTYVKFKKR